MSKTMEANPIVKFLSKEDEINYWMNMAHCMYEGKEDAERILQEYQDHSQILEKELEASFDQSERRNRELRQTNYKLSTDNDNLKNRLNEQIVININLESEIRDLKSNNEQLLEYVRKLEQTNDDLERCNREKTLSGNELESQCNSTLEKLAILETELDELEHFKAMVYRLKEENKDLKEKIELEFQKQNNSIYKSAVNESRNTNCFNVENELKGPVNNILKHKIYDSNDTFDYLQQLEKDLENYQKEYTVNKLSAEKLKMGLNFALNKIMLLQKELNKKENEITTTRQRWKDENKDWSNEVELRLKNRKKDMEKSLPRCDIVKYQKENLRNPTLSRLNHHIRNRAIKVNEEAKRQRNLIWFINRRYLLLTWLRKKK